MDKRITHFWHFQTKGPFTESHRLDCARGIKSFDPSIPGIPESIAARLIANWNGLVSQRGSKIIEAYRLDI